MSGEKVTVHLLLAKFHEDDEPVVVAAVDRSIWEHWTQEEEDEWKARARSLWGAHESDYEMREAIAEFAPDDLVRAFTVPVVAGSVQNTESMGGRGDHGIETDFRSEADRAGAG